MPLNIGYIRKEIAKQGFDVDQRADGLGKGIDEHIKPLVAVLRYSGFETTASCHGHNLKELRARVTEGIIIEESEYHFIVERQYGRAIGQLVFTQAPFVEIKADKEQLSTLQEIIKTHNSEEEIPWNIKKAEEKYCLTPDFRHTHEALRQSIKPLTEHVFYFYQQSNHQAPSENSQITILPPIEAHFLSSNKKYLCRAAV